MSREPIVMQESDVPLETWSDPVRGRLGFRTLLGDGTTASESLTVGVAEMAPGDWLAPHRHAPAEVYYVLEGEGTMALEDEECAVGAGTMVFVPGDMEHGIRNTGRGPLRFFYAFAIDSFADVSYRFSTEVGD